MPLTSSRPGTGRVADREAASAPVAYLLQGTDHRQKNGQAEHGRAAKLSQETRQGRGWWAQGGRGTVAGDPSPRVTRQHSRRPQATGPDSGGLAGHRGRLETTGSFWVQVTPSDLDLTEMSLLL